MRHKVSKSELNIFNGPWPIVHCGRSENLKKLLTSTNINIYSKAVRRSTCVGLGTNKWLWGESPTTRNGNLDKFWRCRFCRNRNAETETDMQKLKVSNHKKWKSGQVLEMQIWQKQKSRNRNRNAETESLQPQRNAKGTPTLEEEKKLKTCDTVFWDLRVLFHWLVHLN